VPVFSRVILIVLDGAGCGELPDAAAYGDAGSNTLGHVAAHVRLRVPNLRRLGLGSIVRLDDTAPPRPAGAWGRMAEASPGKDSITGHWELAGLVLERPFPTFPHGFPAEIIAAFERRIGRPTIGNVVASGTAMLEALGPEHVRTGAPIVYTSADSVFQLAAHEDVVPVGELYAMCEQAFDLVSVGLGVARVIARPFTGTAGAYTRTANRHDFALPPTGPTLLDRLGGAGIPTFAIGKVHDLFAGRGIAGHWPSTDDTEGMRHVLARMADTSQGLIFANLVDFDSAYGHRNDVRGYAENLERFDRALGRVLDRLATADLLCITGDHGNDPTTAGTDHSREYVPLIVAGRGVQPAALGTRATFADIGQTIVDNFALEPLQAGTSFLEEIGVHHS
jgi:phosphopentomutase